MNFKIEIENIKKERNEKMSLKRIEQELFGGDKKNKENDIIKNKRVIKSTYSW